MVYPKSKKCVLKFANAIKSVTLCMPVYKVGSMTVLKEKRITCGKALLSFRVLHVELEKYDFKRER